MLLPLVSLWRYNEASAPMEENELFCEVIALRIVKSRIRRAGYLRLVHHHSVTLSTPHSTASFNVLHFARPSPNLLHLQASCTSLTFQTTPSPLGTLTASLLHFTLQIFRALITSLIILSNQSLLRAFLLNLSTLSPSTINTPLHEAFRASHTYNKHLVTRTLISHFTSSVCINTDSNHFDSSSTLIYCANYHII